MQEVVTVWVISFFILIALIFLISWDIYKSSEFAREIKRQEEINNMDVDYDEVRNKVRSYSNEEVAAYPKTPDECYPAWPKDMNKTNYVGSVFPTEAIKQRLKKLKEEDGKDN